MAEQAGHGERVAAMFGRIARLYDLLNHVLSFGQDYAWRRALVRTARLSARAFALDLAAGTLDVSLAIARRRPDARVVAADFSLPMLARGRRKLSRGRGANIMPVAADAKRLPLTDGCADAVTIAFGIRNILPRAEAYAEMRRVLKPGGRLCILEFGTASRPVMRGLFNLYLDAILPLLGRVVSGDRGAYRYLADTIRAFPDEETLAGELRAAGFGEVSYTAMHCCIVYLHVGRKPG